MVAGLSCEDFWNRWWVRGWWAASELQWCLGGSELQLGYNFLVLMSCKPVETESQNSNCKLVECNG